MTDQTAAAQDLAAEPVPGDPPATTAGDVSEPTLTLLGSSNAVVCEGDTCWIPAAVD